MQTQWVPVIQTADPAPKWGSPLPVLSSITEMRGSDSRRVTALSICSQQIAQVGKHLLTCTASRHLKISGTPLGADITSPKGNLGVPTTTK